MSVSHATPLLKAIEGQFAFRVVGRPAVPTIEIRSLPCTIGAGERCTLRLRAAGVQLLHCGIIWKDDGCQIQRLSVDTWLNGRSFGVAPLKVGDIVRVGPIELETLALPTVRTIAPPVMEPEPAPLEEPTPMEPTPPGENAQAGSGSEPAAAVAFRELRAQLDRLAERVEAVDAAAALPERDYEAVYQELETRLHALNAAQQAEMSRWDGWRDELRSASDQTTSRLTLIEDCLTRLDDRQERAEGQRDTLEHELARLIEGLSGQGRQIDAQLGQLEQQRGALAVEMQHWFEEQQSFRSAFSSWSDQFARHQDQLDHQKTELDQLRVEWRSEQQLLREQLASQRDELERRYAQLEGERRQLWEEARDTCETSAVAASHWEDRLNRADEAQAEIHNQLMALASSQHAWAGKLEDHERTVAQRLAEIEARATQLAELDREWRAEQQTWQQQTENAGSEAAARLRSLAQKVELLATQQQQAEVGQQDFQQQLQASQAAVREQSGELERRLEGVRREREAWLTAVQTEAESRQSTEQQAFAELMERLEQLQSQVQELQAARYVAEEAKAAESAAPDLAGGSADDWETVPSAELNITPAAATAPTWEAEAETATEPEARGEQEPEQAENREAVVDESSTAVEVEASEEANEPSTTEPSTTEPSTTEPSKAWSWGTSSADTEVAWQAAAEHQGTPEDQGAEDEPQAGGEIEARLIPNADVDASTLHRLVALGIISPEDEQDLYGSRGHHAAKPEADALETETSAEAGRGFDEGQSDRGTQEETDEDEATSAEVADEAPASPRSASELLARLGWKPDEDDREETDERSSAGSHAGQAGVADDSDAEDDYPAERSHGHSAAGTSPAHGGDEDSVEDYMTRLMARIRGEAEPAAAARPQGARPQPVRPEPTRPEAPVRGRVVEPDQGESDADEQLAMLEPGEFTPRNKPPEMNKDLSAMRELANKNARNALHVHSRKQLKNEATGTLMVAIVSILVSFILMWLSTHGGMLTYWASLISLVIAGIFGIKYLYNTGQLFARGAESDEEEDEEEED